MDHPMRTLLYGLFIEPFLGLLPRPRAAAEPRAVIDAKETSNARHNESGNDSG